jgi:hypothetical protein
MAGPGLALRAARSADPPPARLRDVTCSGAISARGSSTKARAAHARVRQWSRCRDIAAGAGQIEYGAHGDRAARDPHCSAAGASAPPGQRRPSSTTALMKSGPAASLPGRAMKRGCLEGPASSRLSMRVHRRLVSPDRAIATGPAFIRPRRCRRHRPCAACGGGGVCVAHPRPAVRRYAPSTARRAPTPARQAPPVALAHALARLPCRSSPGP